MNIQRYQLSFDDIDHEVQRGPGEACGVPARVEGVPGRGLHPQPPHDHRQEEEELGAGERLPQALPPPVPERDEVVRLAEPAALGEKPSQSLVRG